jgi:2-dehydropantoate 2-reductase
MILVVGAGAVGSVLAAHLAAAGRDVALYARPKDVARFSDIAQLRVEYADGRPALQAPRPRLVSTLELQQVTLMILGVKYPDLEALIDTLPDPLPPNCRVVSTLNGVAPLRLLRQKRPHATVLPMSVMMNAQLVAPLHARLTTRAEIVLGSEDPAALAPFRGIGIHLKTAQGDEAVWGKLLINLANAICALTRTTFKDLFTDPDLRRVYVAVLDEATAALDAAGLRWKLPLVLPYGAYRWALLHGGPLPWWFAKVRNGVGEGAYPSMVADVQAGRVTEVAQLNGEIVRLGASAGAATPINARIVALIEATREPPRLAARALREALHLP